MKRIANGHNNSTNGDGKGKRARCHNLWGENNRGNWKWFKVRAKKRSKNDKTGGEWEKKSVVAANESGMYWRWSLNWILRKTRVIVQSWCQLSFGVSRFVIQHYASKFVRMLRWIWFNQNTILSMPSPFHLISVFALSFNWLPLSFFFSVCLSLSVKINSVCLARQHADTNGTQLRKKSTSTIVIFKVYIKYLLTSPFEMMLCINEYLYTPKRDRQQTSLTHQLHDGTRTRTQTLKQNK